MKASSSSGFPLNCTNAGGKSPAVRVCNAMVIFGLFSALIEKFKITIERMKGVPVPDFVKNLEQQAKTKAQERTENNKKRKTK